MSEPRQIEAPDAEWIYVDSVERLDELLAQWKRDMLRQVAQKVVDVLFDEGVPHERIADIAAPAVVKAYHQMAVHADAAAAVIERGILDATQH